MADQNTPPATPLRRGRRPGPLPRGTCPGCGKDRALRKNGALAAHNRLSRHGHSLGLCPGVDYRPGEQLPDTSATTRPASVPDVPLKLRTRHVVDWPRLIESVEIACEIRGCSLRDVAKAIGVSSSGLTRMRQGKALAADALASLVAWLYPASIPTWIKEA